jgi:hypothetical protein
MIFESDTATEPIYFPQVEDLLCLKRVVAASDLYHFGTPTTDCFKTEHDANPL